MDVTPSTTVGDIGNYYGGLEVKQEGGKFFWSIENYDGCFWQEIPESLFTALINFNSNQDDLS